MEGVLRAKFHMEVAIKKNASIVNPENEKAAAFLTFPLGTTCVLVAIMMA